MTTPEQRTAAAQLLVEAHDLLTPETWVKYHHATDADGKNVPINSPSATCWCATAAVIKCANDDETVTTALCNLALNALYTFVGKAVPAWNDAALAVQEIHRGFEGAIAVLVANGPITARAF